ncbi:hypothetical protein QAD02_013366 [Eretmocerus hayati]|uniref:Uncharacterized protein n=1 Tax=Eretmocerus hayati TaxID=131215 RepID=A0ACC2P2N1_9HYME|nr:hypothetical protein QAD02_013366 [Eretmocerus hayati]
MTFIYCSSCPNKGPINPKTAVCCAKCGTYFHESCAKRAGEQSDGSFRKCCGVENSRRQTKSLIYLSMSNSEADLEQSDTSSSSTEVFVDPMSDETLNMDLEQSSSSGGDMSVAEMFKQMKMWSRKQNDKLLEDIKIANDSLKTELSQKIEDVGNRIGFLENKYEEVQNRLSVLENVHKAVNDADQQTSRDPSQQQSTSQSNVNRGKKLMNGRVGVAKN